MTFETRGEYVDRVLQTRLEESKRQVEAIKRGLGAVVPVSMLSLLTWRELEVHVCGRPVLDVALLRANTTYRGFTKDDVQMKWFWQVRASSTRRSHPGFTTPPLHRPWKSTRQRSELCTCGSYGGDLDCHSLPKSSQRSTSSKSCDALNQIKCSPLPTPGTLHVPS